jgi:CHAD domain-containing protein
VSLDGRLSREETVTTGRSPGATAILDPRADRLLSELRRIRKNPAGEEAVHDARVACRRFLAAGTLWVRRLPSWPSLGERLIRLIQRLGRVRNLDVTIGLLQKGPRAESAARTELVEFLKRRRRKERARLARWMTVRRTERLAGEIRRVRKSLRTVVPDSAPSPSDLVAFFQKLARLAGRIDPQGSVEAGHEARRELRRLRYAHETLAWAFAGGRFSRDTSRFRAVQQLAGDWHDLCVLEELALKAARKGKISASLDVLVRRVREDARKKVLTFISSLQALSEVRARVVSSNLK